MGVVICLAALALIDGACSGYRASLGRTGAVLHRAQDIRAAARGVALVLILLIPGSVAFGLDATVGSTPMTSYTDMGPAMLLVLLPYATIVVLALAAYGLLSWRLKYLAMALILGPFTLVRPPVAVAAAILGALAADTPTPVLPLLLTVVGVLLVEPVAGRLWFRKM